jgi:hypothetical protein
VLDLAAAAALALFAFEEFLSGSLFGFVAGLLFCPGELCRLGQRLWIGAFETCF